MDILQEQTKAFQYERALLLRVKDHRLSKVSLLLDEGEVKLAGFSIPNVPYLVFEMADGDVRSSLRFSGEIDLAWKLASLHNIAVGLQQLHGLNIGHQDLKASNVLLYEDGVVSKLGDLGRSLCGDIVAPHQGDNNFPGDINYAPPEFIYQYIVRDLSSRMRATDLYLFGSLIVFYFTGLSMNSMIFKNMDARFRWDNWYGTFDEVKAYLTEAFYKALDEFRRCFADADFGSELTEMVRYCCFPDPEQRGHPKGLPKDDDKNKTVKPGQYESYMI